jgi:hypothetical protein
MEEKMFTIFQNSGSFIWPILIIFLGIFGLSFSKYYQLFVKKEFDLKKLKSVTNIILYLGISNSLIGCFFYFFHMYTSSSVGEFFAPFLLIIVNTSHPDSLEFLTSAADHSIKCSSLAMVTIFLTTMTAFLWFGLSSKITKIKMNKNG